MEEKWVEIEEEETEEEEMEKEEMKDVRGEERSDGREVGGD